MNIEVMSNGILIQGKTGERSPRREIARQLMAEGKTYKQAGEILGVSRQRVQQLVRPTDNLRKMIIEKSGNKCSFCGKEGGRLHIHHPDYLDNEAVVLCKSCHRRLHGGNMTGDGINKKFTVTRIDKEILDSARKLAEEDHRSAPQEIRWLIEQEIARRENVKAH